MSSHKKSVAVVEYDKVFTYDHLFQAFKHCQCGKRFRQTVIDFNVNLERKLTKMHRRLKHHRYKSGDLYEFTIYEPKKRDIVANQFADKLIQWIDCEYILMPTISPMLIFDNYASQPRKGTDLARDRLVKFYHKYWNRHHTNDGYVLRCDIKSYFASIDREVLMGLVKKLPIDKECYRMLKMQVYAHHPENTVGVCIGFQSMQWLAVFYLNGLDHYIKEELRIDFYGRYMDDFYLVHEDKEYLQYCYKKIKEYIETKLHLRLNPKSGITRLDVNMNWLGFNFRLTENGRVTQKVTKKSIARYIKRIDKYIRLYLDDEILLEQIGQSIASWKAHIDHATNNGKMKRYLIDKVAAICDKYDVDPELILGN
mgnify:CR=1 FL=1